MLSYMCNASSIYVLHTPIMVGRYLKFTFIRFTLDQIRKSCVYQDGFHRHGIIGLWLYYAPQILDIILLAMNCCLLWCIFQAFLQDRPVVNHNAQKLKTLFWNDHVIHILTGCSRGSFCPPNQFWYLYWYVPMRNIEGNLFRPVPKYVSYQRNLFEG